MKRVFIMKQHFGRFGGDPDGAICFRQKHIEPVLQEPGSFVFDFEGMAGINSSFANALIANLVHQHSTKVMEKLEFINCTSGTRSLIGLAVQIGEDRYFLRNLEVA